MPIAYKILGQQSPSASVETDLYTVPAATQAVVSSLVICNRSGSSTTFRVSVSAGGGATVNKDYLYFDIAIPAYETFIATVGLSLGTGDKVRVLAASADLSFNLFGSEVT